MKKTYLDKIFLSLLLMVLYSFAGELPSVTQAYAASATSMKAVDNALSENIENGVRVVNVTASKIIRDTQIFFISFSNLQNIS